MQLGKTPMETMTTGFPMPPLSPLLPAVDALLLRMLEAGTYKRVLDKYSYELNMDQ